MFRGRKRTDPGFALVAVVVALAVLSLFLLTALAYTLNAMDPARRDQDSKAAQQAALAGVDEYLSRLNGDDNYWQKGDDDPANPAFTDDGRPIQGTGGASSTSARYSYFLLSSVSDMSEKGVIRLRVTGMSGPAGRSSTVRRSVTAELNRSGLLNYVYLTDFEVVDPELVNASSNCGRYYYAIPGKQPARPNSCASIQWGANDTVDGPLHSNDALEIAGPVNFTDPKTETSWPETLGAAEGSVTWWGSQRAPLAGYSPKYADTIALPESNDELRNHVPPNIDADGQVGKGCNYTGATRITLQGDTMKVLSPSTTASNVPSRCYTTSTPGTEQTKSIPPVIYVDSIATSCSFRNVGYPAQHELYTDRGNDAAAWQSTVTYRSGPNNYQATYQTTNYSCTRGTVYVQGRSNTPVTIAGADDVVITGDLTVNATGGATVIGLIAGNCVWVYHPLRQDGNSVPANLNNRSEVNTVQAAILALRHSFVVQNWNGGTPLGNLNVYGAIAQKFRGPVGTGTPIVTGYAKKYVYDGRLSYIQPPYFLKATNSPYKIVSPTDG